MCKHICRNMPTVPTYMCKPSGKMSTGTKTGLNTGHHDFSAKALTRIYEQNHL